LTDRAIARLWLRYWPLPALNKADVGKNVSQGINDAVIISGNLEEPLSAGRGLMVCAGLRAGLGSLDAQVVICSGTYNSIGGYTGIFLKLHDCRFGFGSKLTVRRPRGV